jgi:hypothetical protein
MAEALPAFFVRVPTYWRISVSGSRCLGDKHLTCARESGVRCVTGTDPIKAYEYRLIVVSNRLPLTLRRTVGQRSEVQVALPCHGSDFAKEGRDLDWLGWHE